MWEQLSLPFMIACSDATSSCHWLRTWSMASCLVFSETVATALMVSISARASASWAWMELSSTWAPSSAVVCLFSSSGEGWGGSKITQTIEGERNTWVPNKITSLWGTDRESKARRYWCIVLLHRFRCALWVFQIQTSILTKNLLLIWALPLIIYPAKEATVCRIPVLARLWDPYLPWKGRALWTWLASGWTRPPAAVWVWWTRPSPAPELPLAAGAPLEDGEKKDTQHTELWLINCWLHKVKNRSFKLKTRMCKFIFYSLQLQCIINQTSWITTSVK